MTCQKSGGTQNLLNAGRWTKVRRKPCGLGIVQGDRGPARALASVLVATSTRSTLCSAEHSLPLSLAGPL